MGSGTSKIGIAFLASGVIFLGLLWVFVFGGSMAAFWTMLSTAIVGGAVLFGLMVAFVGLLILVL